MTVNPEAHCKKAVIGGEMFYLLSKKSLLKLISIHLFCGGKVQTFEYTIREN